jgi:hypothetical protein
MAWRACRFPDRDSTGPGQFAVLGSVPWSPWWAFRKSPSRARRGMLERTECMEHHAKTSAHSPWNRPPQLLPSSIEEASAWLVSPSFHTGSMARAVGVKQLYSARSDVQPRCDNFFRHAAKSPHPRRKNATFLPNLTAHLRRQMLNPANCSCVPDGCPCREPDTLIDSHASRS